jgi:nucleoside-diphosphate-sugar epimerase
MRWLIYGAQGWIGSYFVSYVKAKYPNITLLEPSHRADDIEGVRKDLDELDPDRVVSFIGRTSGPGCNSIDYLEGPGKLVENVRDNLFAPVILMKLCEEERIHFTYLGTGCIFNYTNPDDPPFTADAKPNFTGSSYSTVKGFTDQFSNLFSTTLNVRIRMPIIGIDHPKNLLSKIIRYPKICNTLNSVSVLDDIIPVMVAEILGLRKGTINLVNPGPIDHVTILDLYRKHVKPEHTYSLMTEDEQNAMLKSLRAKNTMIPSTGSYELPSARDSIERIFASGTFK